MRVLSAAAASSIFGPSHTTAQMVEGIDLRGKTVVVTGGSTGVGLEAARALAMAGASIFLGSRNETSLMLAKQYIVSGGGKADVSLHALDLTSVNSIVRFAEAMRSLHRVVNIVLCCAGRSPSSLDRNAQGIESQFMIHYLGHALLLSLLRRPLVLAEGARVITLSSPTHQLGPVDLIDPNWCRRSYEPWLAHGQAKTAASLLALQVHERLGRFGVEAWAAYPGVDKDAARMLKPHEAGWLASRFGVADLKEQSRTTDAGAATCVWAATSPELTGRGFGYLEDCHPAPLITLPTLTYGVMPYACDPDLADRLWRVAEELLSVDLPL